jgi:hypothetical protein
MPPRNLSAGELRQVLTNAFATAEDPGERLHALFVELVVSLHSQGLLLSTTIDQILDAAEKKES